MKEKIEKTADKIESIENRIEDTKWRLNQAQKKYHSAVRRGDQEAIKDHAQSWEKAESELEDLYTQKDNLKDEMINTFKEWIRNLKDKMTEDQIKDIRDNLS